MIAGVGAGQRVGLLESRDPRTASRQLRRLWRELETRPTSSVSRDRAPGGAARGEFPAGGGRVRPHRRAGAGRGQPDALGPGIPGPPTPGPLHLRSGLMPRRGHRAATGAGRSHRSAARDAGSSTWTTPPPAAVGGFIAAGMDWRTAHGGSACRGSTAASSDVRRVRSTRAVSVPRGGDGPACGTAGVACASGAVGGGVSGGPLRDRTSPGDNCRLGPT